eukprot:398475_1
MGNRRSRTVVHHHRPVIHRHVDNSASINAEKEKELKRLNNINAENARKAQERMESLRNQERESARRAAERLEQQRAAHTARMKALENADKDKKRSVLNESINRVQRTMNDIGNTIHQDQDSMTVAKENEKSKGEQLKKLEVEVAGFDNFKKIKLNEYRIHLQIDAAYNDFKRDDDEIQNAITKTGQHEENVGKFLDLTHGLIGATMNTDAETNKLDAAMGAFGVMITNECSDKLTIEYYFNDMNLKRFIPILEKERFETLQSLTCGNEDEFKQDFLPLFENGIKKQLEAAPAPKKDDEKAIEAAPQKKGIEACKELLDEWGLSKYFETLCDDEGYDDIDDWEELTVDELVNDINFKKPHAKRFIKKHKEWKQKLNEKKSQNRIIKLYEQRKLEDICLRPETWKEAEKEKAEVTKLGLMEISPLLGGFFGKIHIAITETEEILNYKQQLNGEQLKAIKMRNTNNTKLKAIKMRKSDNEERKKWGKGSEVKVYSDTETKWYNGKIINMIVDDEGEWLEAEYYLNDKEKKTKQLQRGSEFIKPIQKQENVEDDEKDEKDATDSDSNCNLQLQCTSLTKAAIIKINVTDSMSEEFFQSQLSLRAYTLAMSVENCCMRIINSQGQIRQSVFLGSEILKLKPANMKEETKVLWDAVDAGIVQIFNSALEMVKVSATYFSFFLRFQSSFQYFISCYQQNENISLFTSLERLKKDVREFNAFKENFSNSVAELSKTAMKCIENCVKKAIGAASFAKARESREKTLKIYLSKQKLFDEKGLNLDNELEKMKQDKIQISAESAAAKYDVEKLTNRIQQNKQYLAQCQNSLNELQTAL